MAEGPDALAAQLQALAGPDGAGLLSIEGRRQIEALIEPYHRLAFRYKHALRVGMLKVELLKRLTKVEQDLDGDEADEALVRGFRSSVFLYSVRLHSAMDCNQSVVFQIGSAVFRYQGQSFGGQEQNDSVRFKSLTGWRAEEYVELDPLLEESGLDENGEERKVGTCLWSVNQSEDDGEVSPDQIECIRELIGTAWARGNGNNDELLVTLMCACCMLFDPSLTPEVSQNQWADTQLVDNEDFGENNRCNTAQAAFGLIGPEY